MYTTGEISVAGLYEKYGNEFYYIENEKNTDLKIKKGLNIYNMSFNSIKFIFGKGIYFYSKEHLIDSNKKLELGEFSYVRKVTLIMNSKICIENGIFKTDKIILSDKIDCCVKYEPVYINRITTKFIMKITEITEENLIDLFVNDTSYFLEKKFKLSEKSYIAAIKQNGELIQYIENQTEEMCFESVKQDPYNIRFVIKKTEELCLFAVKSCGFCLKYIDIQTKEMCVEAVKQHEFNLVYVQDKNYDICNLAYEIYGPISFQYIKDRKTKIYFLARFENEYRV